VTSQCVGSMGHLVWCKKRWNRSVRCIALLQEVVSYVVKQYLKLKKKCTHEDSYLHHQDDVLLALHQVLNQLLLILVPFLVLLIPTLAGLTK
jgi:hypothetical protein